MFNEFVGIPGGLMQSAAMGQPIPVRPVLTVLVMPQDEQTADRSAAVDKVVRALPARVAALSL
jgi:hypothetical protein